MDMEMEESNVKVTKQSTKKSGVMYFVYAVLLVVPALFFWVICLIIFTTIASIFFDDDEICTVARVPLQGVLMTTDNGLGDLLGLGVIRSADSVVESIETAESDDDIVAIVLDVDSPGGTPLAGDEIMRALRNAEKPVVAVVRDRGTSAAYWAMSGADHIVASPVSDIGSIGVTMSYLELASSTDNSGSRWIDLSSGSFKDAGNPERVLSEEEEEYFQGQVDSVHEYMVDRISESRSVLTKEELSKIADGRAFLGSEALELNLIDALGSFPEALDYVRSVLLVGDQRELILCPSESGGLGDLLL